MITILPENGIVTGAEDKSLSMSTAITAVFSGGRKAPGCNGDEVCLEEVGVAVTITGCKLGFSSEPSGSVALWWVECPLRVKDTTLLPGGGEGGVTCGHQSDRKNGVTDRKWGPLGSPS